MATLQEKLAEIIPGYRDEVKNLVTNYADKVVSNVTLRQAYGGMRGVVGLVCDTSVVSPDKGLIIRGIPVSELTDKLPEEIFYLLLTGELPDKDALKALQDDFKKHSKVPGYVWDVVKGMGKDAHPMAMLSAAILALEKESAFRKRYTEGMKKTEYWEPAVQDGIQLIAKLPTIAAGIYRIKYNKGDLIPSNPQLDWGADFAYMMGIDDPKGDFAELMRLYMTLHSDHEGGNVSAFTGHVVASALSDIYYAISAALNGLAGPLHGLANQECLNFVLGILDKHKGAPNDEQLKEYCWDTLNSGQVIPGYGHAVLRTPDPRFVAFVDFGRKYCADDPVFQIVDRLYAIVPDILKEQGKAKNPWPNVDAGSGSLLYHYGVKEFEFYTVFFGVSRAMGISSQIILNRALGTAITRPKSQSTKWMKDFTSKA
jgi:citrate synthase